MAATLRVACSTTAYQALTTTETAATLYVARAQQIRLHIGPSLPSPNTTDFITINGPTDNDELFRLIPLSEFGIGAGDEVYVMVTSGSTYVRIISGNSAESQLAVLIAAMIEAINDAALVLGPQTSANSLSITGNTSGVPIPALAAGTEYETVAASQTAQVLGATGATGDLINGILVIPATTSPGNVILLDNATSITVFTGGASSVSNLVPFFIPLGMKSVSGAWKLTTGANVSCIGIGDFT